MPIHSINDTATSLHHVCAHCKREAQIAIAKLSLGAVHGPWVDHNLIALPACECGAVEHLNRTFDSNEHPDETRAAHRKKVNALAQHLKAKGQVHKNLREHFLAETVEPSQIGKLAGRTHPPHRQTKPLPHDDQAHVLDVDLLQ